MTAALVGSHLAANPGWREPDKGVLLFVETNGVHVSLIVPLAAEGGDLSDLIRPDQLTNARFYGTHVMIGWGEAGVYRNAETWHDVNSGDITGAIIGSNDTLLHVYHLNNPQPAHYRKAFKVTESQYRRIIKQIRGTFQLTTEGESIAHPAYGPDNIFYEATGRYSSFHTCNNWTGEILRNAGIRMGIWTPMPGGVMRWFRDSPKSSVISAYRFPDSSKADVAERN